RRRLFLEQMHRLAGHHRRYGVLVDQLREPVPPQQDAEVVKPGNYTLELYPVDEKDRQWCLGFANVIEKGVLQVLRFFRGHAFPPVVVLTTHVPNATLAS